MTTVSGGNEVFRPTPIIFEKDYDMTKMRRLAADVVNIANRLASLSVATTGGAGSTVPSSSGVPVGNVLTVLTGGTIGWAPVAIPTGYPYGNLGGVPATFAPSVHLIASVSGVGSAHSISAAAPSQVLKSTGTTSARMDFLNLQELGDVDPTGLAAGLIPTWNGTKFVMASPGGYTGLTVGNVLTATSATTAAFQPLSSAAVVAAWLANIAGTGQWGFNPSPTGPNRDFAGTKQYAQLNIPANPDTLLGGDMAWHPVADIAIDWAQLSNVPGPVSRLTGLTAMPGWGLPLNGVIQLNFNATTATLLQTAQALAKVIYQLEQAGILAP